MLIMLQRYDICTLHFMYNVNPYFYQIISSSIDHKRGNEFSAVLLSFQIVYISAKFLLPDATLTSY